MPTNFVIVGRMRCGSSSLCSYLNSHPQINCRLELLHRKNYQGTPSGVHTYLNESIFGHSEKSIRGFKILYHQMWGLKTVGCYIIQDILQSFNCRIIHLVRRNKLESYVSQMLAKQSEVWNAFKSRQIDKHFVKAAPGLLERHNQPITVSLSDYHTYCQRSIAWENAIDELYPENLKIYYEDIQEILPTVLDFLGAEAAPLICDTIRLRVLPMTLLIKNYDEIKRALNLQS